MPPTLKNFKFTKTNFNEFYNILYDIEEYHTSWVDEDYAEEMAERSLQKYYKKKKMEEYQFKLKNKEYLKALAYKKVNDATKDAESLVDELKKNTAVNPLEDAEKLALLLHENKVLQKALGVVNKENSQTQTSLFIEIKSQTQMPAFVKEINALRTDIETSFLEVVDGKNLNEYNAPGYEAAVKSVNKKYMHAILNHYDVNLSDERLSKVHRAASLLEKEHRLLQHGKIKKIN